MKRRGFIATILGGAVAAIMPWRSKADEKLVPKPQAAKFEGDPEIYIDEEWRLIHHPDGEVTLESPRYREIMGTQWREVALWQDDGYCYAIDNKGQLFRSPDSVNWTKVKNA